MKTTQHFILAICLLINSLAFSKDSLLVIYKSSTRIEIIDFNQPEIKRIANKNFYVLDGVFRKPDYGKLKDGEIIVYDRFFQLALKLEFRDSLLILEEIYDNGKKFIETRKIYSPDTITVWTEYYSNEQPKYQDLFHFNKITHSRWFENGQIESICLEDMKGNIICEYWLENGNYMGKEEPKIEKSIRKQ